MTKFILSLILFSTFVGCNKESGPSVSNEEAAEEQLKRLREKLDAFDAKIQEMDEVDKKYDLANVLNMIDKAIDEVCFKIKKSPSVLEINKSIQSPTKLSVTKPETQIENGKYFFTNDNKKNYKVFTINKVALEYKKNEFECQGKLEIFFPNENMTSNYDYPFNSKDLNVY